MSDVELLHFSEENLHTGEGARVLHVRCAGDV